MKTKANSQWSQVWKRNAVVAAIALFVCAAVYLNWNYEQEVNAGKTLGESAMVGGRSDPLVGQSASGSQGASPDQSQPAGDGADGQAQSPAAASGYFANARLNRQQARDNALQLLQQAAADTAAQQEIIDEANASIQAMASVTMSEANIENLITAKGYGDCICFINDDSASVVVSSTSNGLGEADATKIMEIVKEETGLAASKITVIETEP